MFTYAVASCTPSAMVPPSGDVHASPVEFLEELFGGVERLDPVRRFGFGLRLGLGEPGHAFDESAPAGRLLWEPCGQVGQQRVIGGVEARPVVPAQIRVQGVGGLAQVEDERQEFGFIASIAQLTNAGIRSMGTRPSSPRSFASTPRHAPLG